MSKNESFLLGFYLVLILCSFCAPQNHYNENIELHREEIEDKNKNGINLRCEKSYDCPPGSNTRCQKGWCVCQKHHHLKDNKCVRTSCKNDDECMNSFNDSRRICVESNCNHCISGHQLNEQKNKCYKIKADSRKEEDHHSYYYLLLTLIPIIGLIFGSVFWCRRIKRIKQQKEIKEIKKIPLRRLDAIPIHMIKNKPTLTASVSAPPSVFVSGKDSAKDSTKDPTNDSTKDSTQLPSSQADYPPVQQQWKLYNIETIYENDQNFVHQNLERNPSFIPNDEVPPSYEHAVSEKF